MIEAFRAKPETEQEWSSSCHFSSRDNVGSSPSDDSSRDRECAEWVEMLVLRSYWLRERWFVIKYRLIQILLEEMMMMMMFVTISARDYSSKGKEWP